MMDHTTKKVVADGDDGERGLSGNAHSEDEDTHSEDEDDHSEQETLLYSIEDNGKIFRSVVSCQNIEKQPLSQKYVKQLYDDMMTEKSTENTFTTAPTTTTSSRDVYKEGMESVDTFKKERVKNGKRMDWRLCLSKGLKKGI
ncbi:hypothetical protein HPULCUR_010109 [Helicostylum pulchrum]|uniref:Uncharacterized protein n=1 Tax=Helicostylum pulchrum TaxID=562976 RepID=A0ABP9YEA3_9FUNG